MTEQPDFESIKRTNMYGEDYWSARELMPLLGYGKKWQNFDGVIKKAMLACELARQHTPVISLSQVRLSLEARELYK
jgi:hypothetical protein